MRPEYDFSGGVRGKYVGKVRRDAAWLDDDLIDHITRYDSQYDPTARALAREIKFLRQQVREHEKVIAELRGKASST
jgi:phage host-nuclease inhibitor protein Gam